MTSLKQFAVDEHRGAPLRQMFAVRYTQRLATWVKVHAMTHNVSDSALLRHALEQYAVANGYDALQAAGLQWEADELRRKAGIAEMQRMNERIDESRQVQAQAAERNRQWSEMGILQRLGHEPLSQEQIQANRRKWGIKGQ